MSYRLVQQLASVRQEYEAARLALVYVERAWPEIMGVLDTPIVRLSHIREAARRLEATYIIRLFSEFEALLDDFLAARPRGRMPRTAESLINRVASRTRIPDPIREAAHSVRAYRNTLAHRRAVAVPPLTFSQTLAALNRFLEGLPDSP